MQTNPISDAILMWTEKHYPESTPERLFFEGEQMYITKVVDGKLVTKKAMKDPNYKGNRYDWVENINNSHAD